MAAVTEIAWSTLAPRRSFKKLRGGRRFKGSAERLTHSHLRGRLGPQEPACQPSLRLPACRCVERGGARHPAWQLAGMHARRATNDAWAVAHQSTLTGVRV
eukprot:366573-Chlamydomonas_euryale.AAC.51